MNRWWRVTVKRQDGSERVYFCYGVDWEQAASSRMLFDPVHTLAGMECDASDVPWKVRAKYESTTEELRDALKARGYKVVLR